MVNDDKSFTKPGPTSSATGEVNTPPAAGDLLAETVVVQQHSESVSHAPVSVLATGRFSHAHLTMIRIPAGKFQMGSPSSEADRESHETQHEVTISKSFEIMIYPVTQALWQAVMGNNPSHFKGPDLPVENVNWDDAQEFIKKLNELAGMNSYRLPTEAEWEYTCRAGTNGAWYGELGDIAWYDRNSGNKTHPVGQKRPNAWGLYDMSGNVWEWVQDWFASSYPAGSEVGPQVDPTGPGLGSVRVFRGGSWRNIAHHCRSARRLDDIPHNRSNDLGFRLARSLP